MGGNAPSRNRGFRPRAAVNLTSSLARLWASADRPGVRAFFLSMAALTLALLLALYSGAAGELGHTALAGTAAVASLVLAAWVAITLVPVLARRTPLRWVAYRIEYKLTREGWIYIGGVFAVSIAALNTGNNLLFLILSSLIAVILMSGILSFITLSGVELRLELPEHIFVGQPVRAVVELQNEKLTFPSFSLRVEGAGKTGSARGAILETPVYFPYLPRRGRAKQIVPLLFPERGVYQQEAFRIVTRFPFGFLQKARRVNLRADVLVYPSIDATQQLREILPALEGAMENIRKGHGHDLYALRDYQPADSARHVHWKASARLGALMVREFTRENDRRVLLVFDPTVTWSEADPQAAQFRESFERGVSLCASLAWHFSETGAFMEFRAPGVDLPLAPAREIIFEILAVLARIAPQHGSPADSLLYAAPADSAALLVLFTGKPDAGSQAVSGEIQHIFPLSPQLQTSDSGAPNAHLQR